MRTLFMLLALAVSIPAGCVERGSAARCPACPPCLDRPDMRRPQDLSGTATLPDMTGPADPADMRCSGVAEFCHAPGQFCCPGLTCVGGACALVTAK